METAARFTCRFRKKFRRISKPILIHEIQQMEKGRALAYVLQMGTMITPRTRVNIVQDLDDNRILECALASNARYLITGDNHLLRIGQFKTTQILTPRSFLDANRWI
jgi:putative PIN family toxin of toxin-antitoxin system